MSFKSLNFAAIVIVGLSILFTGCANQKPASPPFYVYIDSLRSDEAIGKNKYILLPGMKDVNENDLQYIEYSKYINRALTFQGYIQVDNIDEAEIAVFLSYGIGDPQTTQYTYSIPRWGQTGISGSNTTGVITSYGSTATYSGTTTYRPTYGITGYSTQTATRVNYFRHLQLEATDLKEYRKTEQNKQLWKTTVTSTGSSGDLRRVFPILVGASKAYIGTSTNNQVELKLYEYDQRVMDIKGIYPQQTNK